MCGHECIGHTVAFFPNKWIQRRLNLQKRKTNCELLLQDPLKNIRVALRCVDWAGKSSVSLPSGVSGDQVGMFLEHGGGQVAEERRDFEDGTERLRARDGNLARLDGHRDSPG